MNSDQFSAHTPAQGSNKWHSLKEHLTDVAELAQKFSAQFGAKDLGYFAGLWHDLGKYNPEFQKYLERCTQSTDSTAKLFSVPHAIHGAKLAWQLLKQTPLAPIIYGHHAGLPEKEWLKSKMADPAFDETYQVVIEKANSEINTLKPNVDFNTLMRGLVKDVHGYDVLTRLLFSCLVDADYLDTEEHFDSVKTTQRGNLQSVSHLWKTLEVDQKRLLDKAKQSLTTVNLVRAEVYDACLRAADLAPGVFRLAVPTGGGKTRSGLAFALKHAVKHQCDRVIIAVPYTSIIEQTVNVYRDIFGDAAVLEHHSAANTEQFHDKHEVEQNADAQQQYAKARLATQNWDAPLIVTTTVQLFESLFANRPSKCRKLHHIVNSVIILDEVQTLPIGLLKPIVSMLRELCDRYRVTVVLCTATQPALEGNTPYLEGFETVRDIVLPETARRHFQQLQRVDYTVQSTTWSWRQLVEDVLETRHAQALIVLNTRKDALQAMAAFQEDNFEAIQADSTFHLSTLLCGKHRREVLADVRTRLQNNQPCFLVSTQVVEAGVDLDFPAVYRALGPLDRIVQAAGRCNREGKRSGSGRVVIFSPEGGKVPTGEYKTAVDETARLLRRENLDFHDPSIFEEYFRCLYQQGTDEQDIQDLRKRLNFPEVAQRFRLIRDDTTSVVVKYDAIVEEQLHQIRRRGLFSSDYRALQPYMVSLRSREFQEAKALCDEIAPGLFVWGGSYHPVRGIGIGDQAIVYDPTDLIY
jgi:CRISPR-associated endonuclease/helicase Cas3